MDSLFEVELLIGICLLFINQLVFMGMSLNSRAHYKDIDLLSSEMELRLGNHGRNDVLNFFVYLQGFWSGFWIPILIGMHQGWVYGVISFFIFILLSSRLGTLIYKMRFFPLLYSICSYTGFVGFYLTITPFM